ncbi:MAG: amidohydrolase family protein [Calditrichaeota bacterium]|nr:amidohydrolase family protein [Calditrichota bacterium]
MSILIEKVQLNDEVRDIFIEGNLIKEINSDLQQAAEIIIDGRGKAALPSFFNGHTHAAMVLLRGYADDLSLSEWLNDKIWPTEARLTEEDVYWGTRLACLEMIKSGTTFFNDMYWHFHGVARAVEDSGIRAAPSAVFIDLYDQSKAAEQIALNRRLFEEAKHYSNRVLFTLGPHAIYTVSKESLQWAGDFAADNDVFIHLHLSETEKEVADCIRQHGKRPVEYLHDIGFLGAQVIAAHAIWLEDREIELLEEHDVKLVYNPTSNMKLASGVFPYIKITDRDIAVVLGTDGCASNNNLDMLEEMKFAALLQKLNHNDPTVLSAHDVFQLATTVPARIFNINSGGIEEGKIADLILVDLSDIHLVPNHQLIPNMVYSGNGGCVDTTICDGKILMQNKKVEGEEEVLERAKEVAFALTSS